MFFFRKRSSVQSSAMCVINLRMFYFSLQLFVCDVTIGEAYVMQMCNFLKVISYKLLLHHQSNPLWLWCVSGSVTQALLHSDVIHAWLWGGQLWRSAAGRDRFSGWDGNRTHDHRRLHSQQDQGSNRMWRFSRWEEQCVEVAAWLAGSCLCSSGSNAGLKHAGRMWPARTFCSPRDALGEFSNIQHLGVTKFTHRCLKVFGQQVNNFLSNERRDG